MPPAGDFSGVGVANPGAAPPPPPVVAAAPAAAPRTTAAVGAVDPSAAYYVEGMESMDVNQYREALNAKLNVAQGTTTPTEMVRDGGVKTTDSYAAFMNKMGGSSM